MAIASLHVPCQSCGRLLLWNECIMILKKTRNECRRMKSPALKDVSCQNAVAFSEPSPIVAAISSQETASNTLLNFGQGRFLQCWRSAKRLYVCPCDTTRRRNSPKARDNGDVCDRPGESRRRKRTVDEGRSWYGDILGDVGIAIVRGMATVLWAGVQPCRHLHFKHGN